MSETIGNAVQRPRFALWHWVAFVIFGVFLFSFSISIGVIGVGAITARHYEMPVSSNYHRSEQLLIFAGEDAVRVGIGFIALSSALFIGAAAFLVGLLRAGQPPLPSPWKSLFGTLMLGGFAMAIICFFPPWRLDDVAFYLTLVVMAWEFNFVSRHRRFRRHYSLGLLAVALVSGYFNLFLGEQIGMAVGLSYVIWIAALVTFPSLAERILPAAKK